NMRTVCFTSSAVSSSQRKASTGRRRRRTIPITLGHSSRHLVRERLTRASGIRIAHSDRVNSDSNVDARLSYLDAESVRGPFRSYRDVSVWNDDDGDLGRLDGIVV